MRWMSHGTLRVPADGVVAHFQEYYEESVILCLSGKAILQAEGSTFPCSTHDTLYLPRDISATILAEETASFCVCSAPVKGNYPLHFVPYSEITADPTLRFVAGAAGAQREINLLVAHNVEAGRLIVGVTRSLPGNWTSWPPHEHAATLEEIYLYYDMPEPAYGLQLLYEQQAETPNVTVVREGDAVLLPRGYHPNVAIPGHQLNFVWMMAAHREGVDRQWGVVNSDPNFS